MSRRRRSADEWRGIIRDERRSGLSVAQFCRRARVQPVTFYAWRRRWHDDPGFVEVKIADDGASGAPHEAPSPLRTLELRLPRERSVLIPPGFDPRTLRALLAVLEGGAPARDRAEGSA